MMVKFHETLSERSVYLRYFQTLKLDQRVTHERLLRRCFVDYEREIALVAEAKARPAGQEILGVARLMKIHATSEAEFSILVSDSVQRQGLGLELLKRLLQIARDEKITRVRAEILRENGGMQRLCEKLEFKITGDLSQPTVLAEIQLP